MKQSLIYPLIISLIFFGSCKKRETITSDNLTQPISVKTEEVKTTIIANAVSVSGNVEGYTTVNLGFLVAGKIDYESKKEGENISQGQLIASLDPTNYAIAKGLADVQVNSVADEFNRIKILHDSKSLSDDDFSKIGFSLQQVKLQQQLQQKNLSDTKLYSPISGVLLKKQAEVGEIVGVGVPLFEVSNISKVNVLAYVPEGELHDIKIGQTAAVFISSLDKGFAGKVKEVGSAADAASRAFTIKIEVENPGLLIRPGMVAEAKITTNKTKQVILLPAECIQKDLANQSYVYVIDNVQQDKAFKRRVSLGDVVDNQIEVLSGLSGSDIVITSGQNRLSDGSIISITK